MVRFATFLLPTACFGLAGYFAWLGAASAPPPPAVAPLSAVGSDAIDLGVLDQGAKAATSFELVNNVSVPITVQRVFSTCGCATPAISRMRIPPGETARVDVEYHSKASRGAVQETVDVQYYTDDSRTLLSVQLQVKGTVIPDYDVTPVELVFPRRTASVKRIKVRPHQFLPLEISQAISDRDWFKVACAAGSQPHTYVLTVEFDPAKFNDVSGEGKLAIQTNSPNQPTFYLPLTVKW